MTTAPQQNRHPVGARAVFSVRSPGPGSARPLAVTALLDAVRAVIGVRDAELRTAAGGDRTLHLDLVDGADEAAVAWSVTRILNERLGVEVDQTRSVLVDDSVDEGRGVPLDGPQRRVHLERLQVVTGGLDVRVDVALATAAARVVGSASGPAVERTVLRTVAGATLNAVDALLEGRARCGLDQAELTDIGSDRLAVAVVTLLTPGQVDRLAGVALVRGDARQAMVRAVLSALNRRFESLVPESGSSSASWAQSFPQSAPPLAVENTATYRTIMAGPDLPDEPLDGETEPEPAVAGHGYADVTRSEASPSEASLSAATHSETTQPDAAAPPSPRESTRGGRAARRAAAAARDTSGDVPVAQARAAASAAEPEYAASTPLSSPFGDDFTDAVTDDPYAGSPYRDPIASPTGELEIAPGPGGSTDLGDWAAATWARLVRNDVTKEPADEPGAGPAAPPGPTPAAQAESYSKYQSATETDRSSASERTSGSVPVAGLSEPAIDARTSGDLSAAVPPTVFTPPVEPEAYTPPAEPVWSWPTSDEPAPASAEWTPPRWDEPAASEQPGNVSSPYGRSTNGAAGLGGSYLEREYGGLGAQANGTGAGSTGGGRGRHGRAESPVAGQPAGAGASGSGVNGSGANGYGTNGHGYGQGGLGASPAGTGASGGLNGGSSPSGSGGSNGLGGSGGLGGPGLGGPGLGGPGLGAPGLGGAGGPRNDVSGLGPASGPAGYGGLGPASGAPSGYGGGLSPASGAGGYDGGLSPASGAGGYDGGLGPASGAGGYGGGPGSTPGGAGGYGGLGPASGSAASGGSAAGGPAAGGPATGGPAAGGVASGGPAAAGAGNATPPRRRHAAEPTGTWPVMHDPLGPGGSWADPQPLSPPSQREPSQSERGYRTGEYGILGSGPTTSSTTGAYGGPAGSGSLGGATNSAYGAPGGPAGSGSLGGASNGAYSGAGNSAYGGPAGPGNLGGSGNGAYGAPGGPAGPGNLGGPGSQGGPGSGDPGAGDYRDRRDQPSPRARRRYAEEESGRHGGGNY